MVSSLWHHAPAGLLPNCQPSRPRVSRWCLTSHPIAGAETAKDHPASGRSCRRSLPITASKASELSITDHDTQYDGRLDLDHTVRYNLHRLVDTLRRVLQ